MKEKIHWALSGTYTACSNFRFYCKGSGFTQIDSNLADIFLSTFFLCRFTSSKLKNWTNETCQWACGVSFPLCPTHKMLLVSCCHSQKALALYLKGCGSSCLAWETPSSICRVPANMTTLSETKGLSNRVASYIWRKGGCVQGKKNTIDLYLSFPHSVFPPAFINITWISPQWRICQVLPLIHDMSATTTF